jgi:hypothetical protein
LEQTFALSIGPCGRYDPDPLVNAAIRRRWREWERAHGAAYERGEPCPPPPALEDDGKVKVLAADRRRVEAAEARRARGAQIRTRLGSGRPRIVEPDLRSL